MGADVRVRTKRSLYGLLRKSLTAIWNAKSFYSKISKLKILDNLSNICCPVIMKTYTQIGM